MGRLGASPPGPAHPRFPGPRSHKRAPRRDILISRPSDRHSTPYYLTIRAPTLPASPGTLLAPEFTGRAAPRATSAARLAPPAGRGGKEAGAKAHFCAFSLRRRKQSPAPRAAPRMRAAGGGGGAARGPARQGVSTPRGARLAHRPRKPGLSPAAVSALPAKKKGAKGAGGRGGGARPMTPSPDNPKTTASFL